MGVTDLSEYGFALLLDAREPWIVGREPFRHAAI
jgi:hypothetical protein